jgi:electron transfer flavoprotein alpha subunit
MAQIINPNHRPQMATVRYKVMNAPERNEEKSGKVTVRKVDKEKLNSNIRVLEVKKKKIEDNISDAETIIAIGRGIKSEKDIEKINELADLLEARVAFTRPLIEAGWGDAKRQIGLSGRTVKPKLIITFGISGAVQFTAGMDGSEYVFAIDDDPNAPIFNVANYGIVGDLYEILPELIKDVKIYKEAQ